MSFTRLDKIIDAMYNTGVHKTEAPEAQFAIAAHVHAYPNAVYSVWVYVATLLPVT